MAESNYNIDNQYFPHYKVGVTIRAYKTRLRIG